MFFGVLMLKSPMIITGTFLHPVNIFCRVVYNSTVLVCGLLYIAITTNLSILFCRTSFMASTSCPGYVIAQIHKYYHSHTRLSHGMYGLQLLDPSGTICNLSCLN